MKKRADLPLKNGPAVPNQDASRNTSSPSALSKMYIPDSLFFLNVIVTGSISATTITVILII
jgi:hypothetical protein